MMNSTLEPRTSNLEPASKTDWHCHILPGLDDGPAGMDESIAMARVLCEAGFSTAYCTPHMIRGSFAADNGAVSTALLALKIRLDAENIDIELLPGREYYLDEYLLESLDDCITFQETRYLLVEISNYMSVEFIREACYRIRCRGYIPVIAHPERCKLFNLPPSPKNGLRECFIKVRGSRFGVTKQTSNHEHRTSNGLLEYLVELGCRFQGNIGSFAGIYGESVRNRAVVNLREGLYSYLGSDAHSSQNLTKCLDKGLREIEWDVGAEGLRKLLKGLPANVGDKLLAGDQLAVCDKIVTSSG